jgi:formate hydrogenlyase subunit 6/NADH:ubiquinone oxidoreductase subunit I
MVCMGANRMNESPLPVISEEACTGCGVCAENCPTGAVSMVNEKPAFTDAGSCTYCGICEDLCPASAIELAYEIQ